MLCMLAPGAWDSFSHETCVRAPRVNSPPKAQRKTHQQTPPVVAPPSATAHDKYTIMSTAEEATINPDGSTTFSEPHPTNATGDEDAIPDDIPTEDAAAPEEIGGVDPAIYLGLAVVAFVLIFMILRMRRKRASADVDDFFSNLDGEKVSFVVCFIDVIAC